MPITKSAKKALRQSLARKKGNLSRKIRLQKIEKQIKKLLEKKQYQEAGKMLPLLYKAVDKAIKSNILKKNTGARIKSKNAKLLKIQNKQL